MSIGIINLTKLSRATPMRFFMECCLYGVVLTAVLTACGEGSTSSADGDRPMATQAMAGEEPLQGGEQNGGTQGGTEIATQGGTEATMQGGTEVATQGGTEIEGGRGGEEAGTTPSIDPWLEEAQRLSQEGQVTLVGEAQPLGNPEQGLQYLLYGDFVGGGIPYDTYMRFVGGTEDNVLNREGDNAQLPRNFNAFTVNGARVVGGITCLGCHSSYLNGELVLGLGNTFSNFASSPPEWLSGLLETIVRNTYGEESAEWTAFIEFSRGSSRVAPYTRSPFRGVNPAFVIEAAASSSRDPNTFAWQEEPLYPLEPFAEGISSDVPAWWHVKKKAALYYNGMGRGRFSKMLMQISVVAIRDTHQAAEIHSHFADLLAWIQTLEPPPYPAEIDRTLATEGEAIFVSTCSRCHGTYQSRFTTEIVEENYPNLLISLEQVGTDPFYAQQMSTRPDLSRWINQGWYGQMLEDPRASEQGLGPASMQAFPLDGYVAPPLDGIWATAPYLHNGSIPNLATLLDRSSRPVHWRRDFNSSTYDLTQVGWPYDQVSVDELMELEDPSTVYDTTIQGYGNQGHPFADHLSEVERVALLEYLKSI